MPNYATRALAISVAWVFSVCTRGSWIFLAQVASEKSAPAPVGASSSWSVIGIYLGRLTTAVSSCVRCQAAPLSFLPRPEVSPSLPQVLCTPADAFFASFFRNACYVLEHRGICTSTTDFEIQAGNYAFHGGQNPIHSDASIL